MANNIFSIPTNMWRDTKKNKPNIIWITWENQRRTEELSRALGAELYKYIYNGNQIFRLFFLSLKTLGLLIKIRPSTVVTQNPSIVLTAIVCFFKKLFGYKVIVDRHSNFKFESVNSKKIKLRIFHYLSKYTVKKADLTIVTNEYLCNIVNKWGGRGFILQDKLPALHTDNVIALEGKKNIAFISTFSEDEPIDEVIRAANKLNSNWVIHVTGNSKKYRGKVSDLPPNIRLTGFLSEKDYQSLLVSADLLMVLTTAEHTLTCGAYEGVSLSKPLIISDTKALRDYFYKGVVYSKSDSESVTDAIIFSISNKDRLQIEVSQLKKELQMEWDEKFNKLRDVIAKSL